MVSSELVRANDRWLGDPFRPEETDWRLRHLAGGRSARRARNLGLTFGSG